MGKLKLIYPDLSYKIRGAVFEVYNNLGYGHKEKVYQRALEAEFDELKIPFEREVNLNVQYKGKKVGNYRPDFVVDSKIIIEIKAVKFMPKEHRKQLTNYLKGTGYKLGFLVNFGKPNVEIVRRIWTP